MTCQSDTFVIIRYCASRGVITSSHYLVIVTCTEHVELEFVLLAIGWLETSLQPGGKVSGGVLYISPLSKKLEMEGIPA